MEEKKNKGSLVLIIVLIVIIIGMGLYICYDKFYSKSADKNTNSNNVETKQNEKTVTNISIDSDIVKKAMASFSRIALSDIIYKTGSYDISNINKTQLAWIAVSNVDSDYVYWCGQNSKKGTVSVEMLNTIISEIILDKKITMDDIKSLVGDSGDDYYTVTLNGNKIIIKGSCGFEFEPEDYVERNVIKAETDEDYLYVYEKIAFARYQDGDVNIVPPVDYYKDYARTTVLQKNMKSLQTLGPDETKPADAIPNWDLYNTYKYTFKKVNDVYYFQNFKLSN